MIDGANVAVGQPMAEGKAQSSTPQRSPLKSIPEFPDPTRGAVAAPPSIPQYRRMKFWAEHLSVSERTLKRLLEDDPDVLVIGEKKRGTRVYETRLIPE